MNDPPTIPPPPPPGGGQPPGALLDLPSTLQRLATLRPVFHSEADLQQAFAWQLHLDHPSLRIRLERRPDPQVREAADLWLTAPEGPHVVVEMKYLVREADVVVDGERFVLANQGAHDISRYDVIKDLGRVERWVRDGLADRGVVIVLSNDPGYWRRATRTTIDAAFRLHEGRELNGELAWASHAGAGTTQGRTGAHIVHGRYPVAWRDYASFPGGQQLRALVLDTAVSRQPVRPPPGASDDRSGST